MGEIIDIKTGQVVKAGEQQDPHMNLHTLDNKVHCIPISCLVDIITGKTKLTDMDDWEMIARTALSIVLAEASK